MASGQLMGVFTPLNNVPPTANYATFDTRNSHPTLDFDDSTDESAVFDGQLPPNYGGGGLTVVLYWAATSATTNVCRWQVSIERMDAALDTDADSFAGTQTAGTTTSGTSGVLVTTSIPFTSGAQMDSLVVGEPYRLKVSRDADGTSGTDSLVGDAELMRVVVLET